ncbi:hypothetical protein ACTU44_10370 [Thalassospira sp. SM2505]
MDQLAVPADFLNEVKDVVEKHQPELSVYQKQGIVVLEGVFVVSSPEEGPFDSFQIRAGISPNFPEKEPCVFETGERIPRTADRHVYPNEGHCCLCIWEEWLHTTPTPSFENFLTGVMHDYFVSQVYFETKGDWPYGHRAHGSEGVVESFSELLGVEPDLEVIENYLQTLSMGKLKGHNDCPCGSGERIRKCHREQINQLSVKFSKVSATAMLERLRNSLPA